MDIPGTCTCGRGSLPISQSSNVNFDARFSLDNEWEFNGSSSSVSTSLLTKNKPFPVQGKFFILFVNVKYIMMFSI